MSKPRISKRTRLHSRPRKDKPQIYSLRLYITGQTPCSTDSIRNLKEICDRYLQNRFELEVIDIYQQPERAQEAQIIAAPTLVKALPLPLRKLIGDLSNRRNVLTGLGITARDEPAHA